MLFSFKNINLRLAKNILVGIKMQNEKSKITNRIADLEAFAADELKRLAQDTRDPQMKTKYEQIAGLNRAFFESLKKETQIEPEEKPIDKEISIIMRAYFIEKTLYTAICECSVSENRPNIIDELVDRHTLILRELLTELGWRKQA